MPSLLGLRTFPLSIAFFVEDISEFPQNTRGLIFGILQIETVNAIDDAVVALVHELCTGTQLQVLAGGNDRGADLLASMLTWGWQAAVDPDAGDLLREL